MTDPAYAREEWLLEGFADRTDAGINRGWRFLISKMAFKSEEPVWRIEFEAIVLFNGLASQSLETI
jgi:hypothetical protein